MSAVGTPGGLLSKANFNIPISSTENDLLNVYSDNNGSNIACRNKNGMMLKRTESMPVQKRDSYGVRDLSFDLEQNNIDETREESELFGDSTTSYPREASSKYDGIVYNMDSYHGDGDGEFYSDQNDGRPIRTKSYKKAVNLVNVATAPTDL